MAIHRDQKEVEEFWNKNEIKIKGKNCPSPVFSFEEAGISKKMIQIMR